MANQQDQKIGAGIKAVAIINLVLVSFGLMIGIGGYIFKDSLNASLVQTKTTMATSDYIIPIIIELLIIIAIIFILLKNIIGVFFYFIMIVFDTIYTVVQIGFSSTTLTGLILPIIFGILIYRRRFVFTSH